jgi:hypothetical protein
MRAQKLLRLEALLPVGFFSVTAKESLEPGFSRRYDAIPFLFRPPEGFLPSFLCQAGDFAIY